MMVALDIDGVLADFVTPFVRVLETRAGNGIIDLQSITDPNFSNHPFLSKEIVSECIVKVSNDPGFWEQLEPETYDIGHVTCEWLKKYGIAHPVVYFTQSHKSELIAKLGIDLFVDDRHENCLDVAENTDAVVLMPHRSYNQSFTHPRVQRIHDLDELFAYLEK
jgi:uncharacterized HAD superfamily protein